MVSARKGNEQCAVTGSNGDRGTCVNLVDQRMTYKLRTAGCKEVNIWRVGEEHYKQRDQHGRRP